jgi:hypothetical protein
MIRRSAWLRVGGHDQDLSGVADWELWWRLAKLGPFVFLDLPLTYYRVHEGQMTKNLYGMLREEVRARTLMARRVYPLLRRLALAPEEITNCVHSTRHFFYDYMMYYRRGRGLLYQVMQAIWQHTNEPKAWKLLFRSLIPNKWVEVTKSLWNRKFHKKEM